MQYVKANNNENLFDVAIKNAGSADDVIALAILNGLSITDDLESGELLALVDVTDTYVVANLLANRARPATALAARASSFDATNARKVLSDYTLLNKVAVSEFQNLFDVAFLNSGSIEDVFAWAMLNGLGITDVIDSGTILNNVAVTNKNVVASLAKARPATGDIIISNGQPPEGIGYWYIENDNIVS